MAKVLAKKAGAVKKSQNKDGKVGKLPTKKEAAHKSAPATKGAKAKAVKTKVPVSSKVGKNSQVAKFSGKKAAVKKTKVVAGKPHTKLGGAAGTGANKSKKVSKVKPETSVKAAKIQKSEAPSEIRGPSTLSTAVKKGLAISKKGRARVPSPDLSPESQAVGRQSQSVESDGALAPLAPRRKARAGQGGTAVSELSQKWANLQRRTKKAAVPYKMTERYEAKTPINHKVLGWGYILNNVNDRLEVLFEDGVKILISNYKR